MTTATYRGIQYNVEENHKSELTLVRAQLKKAQAQLEAFKANTRVSHAQ